MPASFIDASSIFRTSSKDIPFPSMPFSISSRKLFSISVSPTLSSPKASCMANFLFPVFSRMDLNKSHFLVVSSMYFWISFRVLAVAFFNPSASISTPSLRPLSITSFCFFTLRLSLGIILLFIYPPILFISILLSKKDLNRESDLTVFNAFSLPCKSTYFLYSE